MTNRKFKKMIQDAFGSPTPDLEKKERFLKMLPQPKIKATPHEDEAVEKFTKK